MILVTGGTGFVGQEVVSQLLATGQKVRLLVRDPRRARRFANDPQVELIEGDVLRPETLAPATVNVQAVIHLVGIIAETSRVTYKQAHFEATRNLLTAAKQAGITRWLQMSAEGTRPDAASRYHLTKWQAEEAVRQSGLDWTIFRPSLIYGYDKRDRLLNLLRKVLSVNWVLLNCLPLLDGGRPLIQPVSVREVAYCFIQGLSKPASIGRTFELVGPVPMSWREMVSKIAAALGKKVIVLNMPSKPLLMITQRLDPLLPRALRTSDLLKMAAEDNIGDPRPAAETFSYEPESFEQGLARIFERQERHPFQIPSS